MTGFALTSSASSMRSFPLISRRLALAGARDALELGHELVDVAEGAVHAREAHVGDLVHFAQLVHDLLAHLLGAPLFVARVDEVAFDGVEDGVELRERYRALVASLAQARQELLPIERLASAVLLDDERYDLFHPLVRGESPRAALAFAAPARDVAESPHARIDHLALQVRAKRASHELRLEPRDDEGTVGAAETERVVEGMADAPLAAAVRDVVERALGVLVDEIDGRRDLAGADGEGAHRALDGPCGPEKVPHHRLRGADPEVVASRPRHGVLAEHLEDRPRLLGVAHRSRRAVCVDVVDLVGGDARVLQGHLHRALGALPPRCGLRQVVGVTRSAIAGDLGVDASPAGLGARQRLEHEDAAASPPHQPRAPGGDGAARGGRIVVAGGRAHHALNPADTDGRDGGLGATGDHDLGATPPNPLGRLTEGVRSARARARRAVARSAKAVRHRELSGREVRDDARDRIRADLGRTLLEQHLLGLLERDETAQSDADEAAGLVAFGVR